jgi:digeranylgeranylglycerophospholipid reductase
MQKIRHTAKSLIRKGQYQMKVAIIGAGLSGLSCALELERRGIIPDIFEKKEYIGEECNMTAMRLNIFERARQNMLNYLRKKYGLVVHPYDTIRSITMLSQSQKATIKGKLGYMFIRGNKPESLEHQIAAKLNSKISFNKLVRPADLSGDYRYIVVATGTPNVPQDMDNWLSRTKGYVRVGTAAGRAAPSSVKIWFNTAYSRNCFCCLAPGTGETTMLMLVADTISHNELEHYWMEFVENECCDMKILETRDQEFDIGTPRQIEHGKIYLTGNAGGFLEDFLGFGTIEAIESGFLAARSISGGLSYTSLAAPLIKHKDRISTFRKLMATFNNDDYDRMISLLTLPGIKQFIYRNPFFKVGMLSPFVYRLSKSQEHNIK